MLGLAARIIGILSILAGLLFYFLKPQFKVFAIAMLILGAVEAGVFIIGYFVVNNQAKVDNKLEVYQNTPKEYLQKDKIVVKKNLRFFLY